MAEDAEHAAFLAQRVALQIGVQQVEIRQTEAIAEVQIAEVEIALCDVAGRALYLVHRASLLAWYQRAAGFSISFFRLSRAGLL